VFAGITWRTFVHWRAVTGGRPRRLGRPYRGRRGVYHLGSGDRVGATHDGHDGRQAMSARTGYPQLGRSLHRLAFRGEDERLLLGDARRVRRLRARCRLPGGREARATASGADDPPVRHDATGSPQRCCAVTHAAKAEIEAQGNGSALALR
jgi:hypothetical protein